MTDFTGNLRPRLPPARTFIAMREAGVTLYTRPGCHLCEDAKAAMLGAAKRHGFRISLREVNIDEDAGAHARYWLHIPVVWIGGEEAFRHRVDPEAFAARVLGNAGRGGADAMSDLAERQCVPCRGGVPALRGAELEALSAQLEHGWSVVTEHHLAKEYRFPDFVQALAFTNRVGALAEEQGHHPDIQLGWGRAGITIWTHAIDGLTESDFVLAAKIDRIEGAGQ